ncbi:MAG: methyltransferase domain-containing protein [bacterium]
MEEYEPNRYLTVDGSEDMIEQTHDTLSDLQTDCGINVTCSSFKNWTLHPHDRYDWIFSSLSIHHISDDEKKSLYKQILSTLSPGGHFLLCDLFEPPDSLTDFYRDIYKHRMLNSGYSEEEFEQKWQSHLENDDPMGFSQTYKLLPKLGFKDVDLVWKDTTRGIFVGRRSK